jgi:hypothetical protein
MMMDRRLLYVLALLEAGMSALASLGGLIFMGPDPAYVTVGAAIATLYIVAGQAASRGRRWGLVTLIVCESVRLTGFGLSAAAGALPWVELTLTGATLADGLILPGVVAAMAAAQLIGRPVAAPPPPPLLPPGPLPATLIEPGSLATARLDTARLHPAAGAETVEVTA